MLEESTSLPSLLLWILTAGFEPHQTLHARKKYPANDDDDNDDDEFDDYDEPDHQRVDQLISFFLFIVSQQFSALFSD